MTGAISQQQDSYISKKAADDLGILKKGTVYAKVTIIKIGDNKVTSDLTVGNNSKDNASNLQTNQIIPVVQPSTVTQTASSNKDKAGTTDLFVTNTITLTNFIPVVITNIITIPPYEDKVVEKDISDNSNVSLKAGDIPNDDEFVMNEPMDNNPAKPANIKEREVSLNDEITPETLLTNNTDVIKKEKGSLKEETLSQKNKDTGHYAVQVGAFSSEESALKLYDLLKKNGFDVFTTDSMDKK